VASSAAPTSECREGVGLTLPSADSDTSLERKQTQDSDDNAADFAMAVSNPENRTSMLPSLVIDDVSVAETGTAIFTVSLSAPSARIVTAEYATTDGTAVAPGDYAATAGVVSLPPGATSATVVVPLTDDALDEDDESFGVGLASPTGAKLADGDGAATILDDDALPALSIASATVVEGGEAVFTVSLSAPSGRVVAVAYATDDGTAGAPDDYAATSGTLTFAPGETATAISVPVVGDSADEPDETFAVELSAPANAELAITRGDATILDDDEPATGGGAEASTPGSLLAAGLVEAHGVLFARVAYATGASAPKGVVRYAETHRRIVLSSDALESFVLDGSRATVVGTAGVNGAAVDFRLEVDGDVVRLSWPGITVSGRLRGALVVRARPSGR